MGNNHRIISVYIILEVRNNQKLLIVMVYSSKQNNGLEILHLWYNQQLKYVHILIEEIPITYPRSYYW